MKQKKRLEQNRLRRNEESENLEEQAINFVGRDIYEKLIKYYTEKQWGRKCVNLPSSIIKRLPVRFTYNNNYFNDLYQGIPIGDYTQIVEKMLSSADIILNCDYIENMEALNTLAERVFYTGAIDAFFNFRLGALEYRTVTFEIEELEIDNYQGNAVINYTDAETSYTRVIEHKHFEFGTQSFTVISKEYPREWCQGDEPYYPINDADNNSLYKQYSILAENEKNVIFCGRLAEYKYYDMDKLIISTLAAVNKEFGD